MWTEGRLLVAFWHFIGSLLAAYASWRDATFQRWQLDEIRQRCRKSTARAGYIAFREIFGKLSGSRSKPLETSQHALKRQGRHALRRFHTLLFCRPSAAHMLPICCPSADNLLPIRCSSATHLPPICRPYAALLPPICRPSAAHCMISFAIWVSRS